MQNKAFKKNNNPKTNQEPKARNILKEWDSVGWTISLQTFPDTERMWTGDGAGVSQPTASWASRDRHRVDTVSSWFLKFCVSWVTFWNSRSFCSTSFLLWSSWACSDATTWKNKTWCAAIHTLKADFRQKIKTKNGILKMTKCVLTLHEMFSNKNLQTPPGKFAYHSSLRQTART